MGRTMTKTLTQDLMRTGTSTTTTWTAMMMAMEMKGLALGMKQDLHERLGLPVEVSDHEILRRR